MARHGGVETDAYVIMPNHMHALVRIGWLDEPRSSTVATAEPNDDEAGRHGGLRLRGAVTGLPKVVQWFKSVTTTDYARHVEADGWPRFPGRLWQPNYYEHIVRDENDLDRIRTYIESNPGKWEEDAEYRAVCPSFG